MQTMGEILWESLKQSRLTATNGSPLLRRSLFKYIINTIFICVKLFDSADLFSLLSDIKHILVTAWMCRC